jgi:NAD(P)-dependent dehydrogenase (short-subunit alcohol dehydrogenase family)
MALAGRVVIVTGAGRGVGRVLVLGLAREGAHVVCVSRTRSQIEDLAQEASKLGARVLAVPTDVTDERQISAMLDAVDRDFGRVDVLVNNAGGGLAAFGQYDEKLREILRDSYGPPFWQMSWEQWSAVLNLDLNSAFLCGKAAVERFFVPQRRGVIINIASRLGVRPAPGRSAYGAAKAGVIHLTQTMAVELRDFSVSVNVLLLPLIKTPLTVGFAQGNPQFRAQSGSGPWLRPEVAVPAIIHLAGQRGIETTGQVIDLLEWNEQHGQGGTTAWLASD